MNRRDVLTATSTALSALVSGCGRSTESPDAGNDTDETGDDTETGSKTATGSDAGATAETEPDTSDSRIVLSNTASTEKRGHLTLSMSSETIFETEFEVNSGERQSLNSGITEIGQYELTVATESASEASLRFSVGAYDLKAGTNLIVEISADDIRILLEE